MSSQGHVPLLFALYDMLRNPFSHCTEIDEIVEVGQSQPHLYQSVYSLATLPTLGGSPTTAHS